MKAAFALALVIVAPTAASQDGTLDPTMGGTGIVYGGHPLGQVLEAYDVAIQPNDGRILVAGGIGTYNSFVARHLPGGARDPSFSGDGFAGFDLTTASLPDAFRAIAALEDGRILVAGYFMTDFMVARLTSSGGLDPTFGETPFNVARHYFGEPGASMVEEIAVTAAGYVAVGGARQTRGGDWSGEFGVLRVTTDGEVDPSFNNGVPPTVDFTSLSDIASAVLEYDDGRLLVAGTAGVTGSYWSGEAAFARFSDDGTLDSTFLDNGFGTIPLWPTGSRVLALAHGPGDTFYAAGAAVVPGPDQTMLVARLHADGSRDGSFGTDGVTVIPLPGEYPTGWASDIAVQADGKILVAGAGSSGGAFWANALVRLFPDGTLDSNFGMNGITITPFQNATLDVSSGYAEAVALQPDGRIVTTGTATCLLSFCGYAIVARYRNQPVTPTDPPPAESAGLTVGVVPNPMRDRATVVVTLSRPEAVRITVHDVLGRQVAIVSTGQLQTGAHAIPLDSAHLAGGLYVVTAAGSHSAASTRISVGR